MKKLSLVVSTIMLSSTMFAASAFDKEVDAPLKKDNIENANSIDEAFKNGKIEGSIALFGLTQDNKDQSIKRDFAFGNGNLTLGYNTASFYGFSLGTQVKGNIKLGEKHKNDRKKRWRTPVFMDTRRSLPPMASLHALARTVYPF